METTIRIEHISPEAKQAGNLDDHQYSKYIGRVGRRFAENCRRGPLFRTNVGGDALWEAYMSGFPASERKYHECNACKHFIARYGGLVTIDEAGMAQTAIWHHDDAPDEYVDAIGRIHHLISSARIQGVFYSPEGNCRWLGLPVTGLWRHVAVELPQELIYRGKALTSTQAEAKKSQDFQTVLRALGEWTLDQLDQALTILEADQLTRSEKFIGPVKWLRDLKQRSSSEGSDSTMNRNKVWRAVALAPEGFCHPRTSVTATLLEDLEAGLSFDLVKKRWNEKMHPLQYQRPQASPAEGNIRQAEELIAKLGLARSLERRFARLDEVETIWTPSVATEQKGDGSVFGHLLKKETTQLHTTGQTMTWVKFAAELLPKARTIQLKTPTGRASFTGILTAVHSDAPPILKWDHEDNRNPFSWYFYNGGSTAGQWALPHGLWVDVMAIVLQPDVWKGRPASNWGNSAFFLLKGCVDTNFSPGALTNVGACLFPELLKGELHGVRATIEAHSKKTPLQGYESASACGLAIGKESGVDVKVDLGSGVVAQVRIDRWD